MYNSARFSSLRYLNIWLEHDKGWHEHLTKGDKNQRLGALHAAAKSYKVARTLPRKFDEKIGVTRMMPVLDIIDRVEAADFTNDTVGNVLKIQQRISKKYGDVNVLSLTTKMLWIKVRSPIIIYDKRARMALGTRDGDLEAFYAEWQKQYRDHEKEISAACQDLDSMSDYVYDQKVGTPAHIKSVASKTWFKHRVFDLMLWKDNGEESIEDD